jgi:hypothetical protein
MFFLLLVAGFNFWIGVMLMNRAADRDTIIELAFNTVPFWIVFILSFPLITMRTYSEEYRQGTFETLTTAPVNDWQVVLSKFLGSLGFYCVLWAPTFVHFAIFKAIAGPEQASMATGAYYGSYSIAPADGHVLYRARLPRFVAGEGSGQCRRHLHVRSAHLVLHAIPAGDHAGHTARRAGILQILLRGEHMRDFAKG